MFLSKCELLGDVTFPDFTGERVYMEKFFKDKGLPNHLKRWQPTIDQMLDKIDIDEPIYLMVDQGIVQPNTAHRREGVHIDGYWIDNDLYTNGNWNGTGRWNDKSLSFHSSHRSRSLSFHGGNSHSSVPVPQHRPTPTHASSALKSYHGGDNSNKHRPNKINAHGSSDTKRPYLIPKYNQHGVITGYNDTRKEVPVYDSHGNIRSWKENPNPPRYDSHGNLLGFDGDNNLIITDDWSQADLKEPESLILASDFAACKGYLGEWSGVIGAGGDCSKVDLSGLTEIILKPNNAYLGNVGFLHESMPIHVPTQRTLVRLNLKGQ